MQLDRNKPRVEHTVCPYCQTTIRLSENTVVCSCCKMPHHLECWIENGQCTTYGCKGHRMPNLGILAHRKQQLPMIDITFDEPQETNGWRHIKTMVGRWLFLHHFFWQAATICTDFYEYLSKMRCALV